MDCLRSWPHAVIHRAHQAIDQRSTLVVKYVDFQDLIPWRTQASGFRIEIDGHFPTLQRVGGFN